MFTNSLLLFQLDDFGRRLLRWSEVLIREYPKCNHTIPNAAEIDLDKIGTVGVINIDTFNGSHNTRQLLANKITE